MRGPQNQSFSNNHRRKVALSLSHRYALLRFHGFQSRFPKTGKKLFNLQSGCLTAILRARAPSFDRFRECTRDHRCRPCIRASAFPFWSFFLRTARCPKVCWFTTRGSRAHHCARYNKYIRTHIVVRFAFTGMNSIDESWRAYWRMRIDAVIAVDFFFNVRFFCLSLQKYWTRSRTQAISS